MNKIICYLFGHNWGVFYRIKGSYPDQYSQQCERCKKHSNPIFGDNNYHAEKLISILELIEINLRIEKITKSKLIKIDDERSINVDYIESIKKTGKFIKICMSSGTYAEIVFNEKDWLKLHQLKK